MYKPGKQIKILLYCLISYLIFLTFFKKKNFQLQCNNAPFVSAVFLFIIQLSGFSFSLSLSFFLSFFAFHLLDSVVSLQ